MELKIGKNGSMLYRAKSTVNDNVQVVQKIEAECGGNQQKKLYVLFWRRDMSLLHGSL